MTEAAEAMRPPSEHSDKQLHWVICELKPQNCPEVWEWRKEGWIVPEQGWMSPEACGKSLYRWLGAVEIAGTDYHHEAMKGER